MSNASATFSGEEITVTFTATVSADYIGDPTVPNGTQECSSVSDYAVDSLIILGVNVPLTLFNQFPDRLQAAILALAEDLDFDLDEPDYDYDYDVDRDTGDL